jgi:pantetheine-phosphate adenylyltransferase/dephospho-CoA kinase
MKPVKAIYAFSGDPITLGHINVIERAALLFPELVIGIGANPAKKYLFTLAERLALATKALSHLKNISIVSFNGLLVDFAYENNIPVVIRGLRNQADFDAELMLHQIGESQQMQIETLFLPTNQVMSHISSGTAKALQLEQGLVFEYVPINVKQKLEEKLSGQYIVGVTGEIGCGKSYVSQQLAELAKASGINVHVIDVDKIAHRILESQDEPLYRELRKTVAHTFGHAVKTDDGYLNRKLLGQLLFADLEKLKQFNAIIYKPLLLKLRRELYGKKGVILLDSALIIESNMAYLCNNNVILVSATKETQLKRLRERNYSEEQIRQRMNSQYSEQAKRACLKEIISKNNWGKIIEFKNEKNQGDLSALLNEILALASTDPVIINPGL